MSMRLKFKFMLRFLFREKLNGLGVGMFMGYGLSVICSFFCQNLTHNPQPIT